MIAAQSFHDSIWSMMAGPLPPGATVPASGRSTHTNIDLKESYVRELA
jgi:hypothetical protein